MSESKPNDERFKQIVEKIVASYQTNDRTHHLNSTFLPSRARTIKNIELFRRLVFPGFFDDQRLTSESVRPHVDELLNQLRIDLYEQIRQSLRYELNRVGSKGEGDECDECDEQAERITVVMFDRIPEIRRLLAMDIQAAYRGDPAAVGTDEAIFCYPGIDAIFIYRVAHELHKLKVPLLPRIMTEYAHNETGVDIHPGAEIGESFFIDHGTGVVIGETTQIGDRVQLYQGVTLGALAPSDGKMWRGRKRHPTIEDDVTIYGGAVILGGETVIGRGAEVNGAVFLITSVPPFHKVRIKRTELEMAPSRRLRRRVEARG